MNTEIVLQTATWWLALAAVAMAGLPLAWRVLGHLPGGGYAFARPVGLLVAGYVYWLGLMFGLFHNGPGAAVVALGAAGAAAWLSLGRAGRSALLIMLHRQRRLVLLEEGLFLLALVAWTAVRAHNPEIAGTEKPMEIAFLNSAVRSAVYPPVDPWLSGFSISYYYFGYVIVAMLTWLSGLPTEVTFNLAIATLFALTVLGTFGLVYELVAVAERDRSRFSATAARFGVIGALLLTLMGNLEGFFEILHSHAVSWPELWAWLGIRDLNQPYLSPQWLPTDTWWWWRASRVIGTVAEPPFGDYTINEFPYFSFMLGDVHPHVLSLPFTVTALALAFAVLTIQVDAGQRQDRGTFLVVALVVGGLGFLNSWDLPTYLAIVVGAHALTQWKPGVPAGEAVRRVATFAVAMIAASILLYLPFYLMFRSQASGIGVVLFTRTQLHHFLIFFGPFVWLVCGLLTWQRQRAALASSGGSRTAVMVVTGLCLVLACVFLLLRLWVAALLLSVLALAARSLIAGWTQRDECSIQARAFVLGLVIVACGLLIFPEFLFIRDTFNNRMNTVFKFYYQAWVLLAVSATYALYSANACLRASGSRVADVRALATRAWLMLGAFLVAGAFIYPVAATWTKTAGFAIPPTLDGMKYLRDSRPDEHAAIKWLADQPGQTVIVEATGPEYDSDFGKVSAFTGHAALLGWAGHELQWRGTMRHALERDPVVTMIYEDMDVAAVRRLLIQYGVDYVYIGSSERGKHGDDIATRLGSFLLPAYRNGSVTIFRVPRGI